jgi:glyoxylase-like metal-dependent hydrolase (beta-lactamase superfamily II)
MSLEMESRIERLGERLYAVIGPEGATNFTLVKANDRSAVLIDADIRRIDEIEAALKLTDCRTVATLINTHEHFDHTSANYYFAQRQIPIVASEGCARAIKEEGEADFVRMMAPVASLYDRFPGLRLTVPDQIFTGSTVVTLPGTTLRLDYRAENGHSHSKGDTTIFFEEEEILIAGDLLYTEVHPVTFFGNIPNWLTALKPLLEARYRKLVPGHGPAVQGQDAGQAYFKGMFDYLADFYANVQEIKSGRKSAEEVVRHMQSGAYAGFGKTRMIQRNIDQFLTGRWY